VPNDPAFQKRVLLAALKLLEERNSPVLEDYPEDAPIMEGESTVLACPVSFSKEEVNLSETEQLCAAFKREFVSMHPWYDMAVKKRGRTTVGVSGVAVEKISDFICSFLQGSVPENPRSDISIPYTLSLVINDLKAYYVEAITAQPGQESTSSQVILDWFWGETVAGRVLLAIKEASKKSPDALMQIVGGSLIVPTKVAHNRK
jgi:hypothetical protein